jgi:FMN phosphatase YigB (HAD superfamily)
MTPTPEAALIDIGNVLLSFDFESALLRLVPDTTPDPLQRVLSLLERKDAFESGQIPEEKFIAWASERLGFTGSADTFRETWRSIFEPIHPMWDAIAAMKAAGLRLFLFSNINSIHGPWILETYPVMDHFDGHVFSYEVGAIKPDPTIYHTAMRMHDLRPETTLYIDDLPANIATGQDLGLPSHQYNLHDHDSFLTWLTPQLPPTQITNNQ